MAKTTKTRKIDYKGIAKNSVFAAINEALGANFTVVDGTDYGFKANTLVVRGVEADGTLIDVKIELSAPKAGFTSYDYKLEEEAE